MHSLGVTAATQQQTTLSYSFFFFFLIHLQSKETQPTPHCSMTVMIDFKLVDKIYQNAHCMNILY